MMIRGKMALTLAVVVALTVTGSAAAAVGTPPKRGQEVHLFEVTVRVPDPSSVDLEEYNYRLLATVLGRLLFSLH
jgi:hypothetical protein